MGHYRADRLVTALKRRGAQRIWLCGPTDVRAHLGTDVGYRHLAAEAGVDEILALWADTSAQVVVPSLYPLEQEQLLHALAVAGHQANGADLHVHVHSRAFAEAVSDKVLFHRLALERGWPVPDGIICENRAQVRAALHELGPPVIVKTGRSVPWQGRWYLTEAEGLTTTQGMDFPVVVQAFCKGEEFGIELFTHEGRTLRWPVASFGSLDERCKPGWRTRVMPTGLPEAARRGLDTFIADVTGAITPRGAWQIDLAVEAGELRVLEVNGRSGGMAHLSRAVTDVDPYEVLAAAAVGARPPSPAAVRAAAELPLRIGADLPGIGNGVMRVEVEEPSPTEPCLPSHFNRTLVVADDRTVLARWIRRVPRSAWADQAVEAAGDH